MLRFGWDGSGFKGLEVVRLARVPMAKRAGDSRQISSFQEVRTGTPGIGRSDVVLEKAGDSRQTLSFKEVRVGTPGIGKSGDLFSAPKAQTASGMSCVGKMGLVACAWSHGLLRGR